MGLFDFFKKKDSDETVPYNDTPKSELFLSINKYSEYLVSFISMQQQGNYAPISAYEKPNGEITGFLYLIGNDSSYSLSAGEVVKRMEDNFEKKLAANEIISYTILYHSQFNNDNNHALATNDDELKAISVIYNFSNEQKGKMALPYKFEKNEITYKGFNDLSATENTSILKTKLKEGKDYFQDREEIKAPVFENEIGIKITRSNNKDLSNTWWDLWI